MSNGFKKWVTKSREEQRHAPERYLGSYPNLVMDENTVWMTSELLNRFESVCGRYDITFPTGKFLGKMFLQGEYLCWYGIDKENPHTHCLTHMRKIVVVK
jgi:hypothetical protein